MNLDKFEWIFFDIGGVLFDESKTILLKRKTGLDIIQKYFPNVSMNDIIIKWPEASRDVGSINENLFKIFLKKEKLIQEALKQLREKKKAWPPYNERNTIYPEAKEVLERLSKKHKIGIIANQPAYIKGILDKADVSKYFNFLGISDEYNLHKPNPFFFEKVLQDSGADPRKSVMIDDNIERGLMTAKKFGFTTIWFNNNASDNLDNKSVDYKINSLKELV